MLLSVRLINCSSEKPDWSMNLETAVLQIKATGTNAG
jgi:hypothetical protein